MEHENELKEALDFVSPSALTYDEWLMVGMALKDSGLPVTLWEQWSTRDAGRYHKGEGVKKWESFHGGGASPVTASSIFQLAYSHGWSGPAGHALDWNDDISAGTGAQTEGRLVDPRWVEAHELALPEQWDPVDQLKRYLQALFEPDEYVAYVTESFMAADRRRPAKGSWTRTAGQLITELDACGGDLGKVVGDCDPEVGAWICFNPVDGTGRKDANITAYRYALVECDNMELGKQQAIIKQLELPCAALVYSGGKSVHAIVKVDAPDYAEYRRRVDYLYSACQKNGLTIDQQNRNPSRLSRMPGILRGDKRQVLLETNIGKLFSLLADGFEVIHKNAELVRLWDDLENAEGAVLDRYGANFGVQRGAASDALYRILIRVKMLAQLSGGDGDTVIRAAGELLGVQFSDIELQDVYPAKVALYVDQSLLSEERLALIDQIAVALKRILTAGVGLRLYLRTYRTYRYDLNIGHGAMVNVVRWLPPVSQDRSSRADFKIGHGGFTEADFYPPIVGKDRLFESRFETSRGTYLPPVIEGVYPDTVQTATMAHEGVRGAVYHTHLKPRRID